MYTVHLHGSLRSNSQVAESYRIDATDAWEAIEGVTKQLKHLAASLAAPMKTALCVGHDTLETLKQTKSGDQEIHLVPALSFAGKGAGRIIIGALKIVASSFVSFVSPELAAALALSGVGDILGGIAQSLSPQPKMNNPDEEEKTKNRYLGTPANTVGMGVRIPRGYGTVRAAGHFLSFNTDAVEVL